jgi:hypothetical protein
VNARNPEIGPIRPPNEAASLLVRVTRNCPWNRCAFCPVYKGTRFSLRDAEEVCADVREMAVIASGLEKRMRVAGTAGLQAYLRQDTRPAVVQVARFLLGGAETVFLQDANSLIMPVDELVTVIRCIREAFPSVRRVTTYARSHTVTKRSVEELSRLRVAGLDRIHIGLESGSDRVLELVGKGATAERHVEAGLRAKQAGLSLSEYVMPGLGGRELSEEHATETARVLRTIDPHFVRLRTLAIPPSSPLAELVERGELTPMNDLEVARELRTLLAGLTDMSSTVRSDHVLNLLEEIDGTLPDDLPAMLGTVDRFLALPQDLSDAFVIGRRVGLLRSLDDLDDPTAVSHAQAIAARIRAQYDGPVDAALAEIMTGFVSIGGRGER